MGSPLEELNRIISGGKKKRIESVSGVGNGMTGEYLATIDEAYRNKFHRGLPGDVYDNLKNNRGYADKLWAAINSSKETLLADIANRDEWKNLGILGEQEIWDYDQNIKNEQGKADSLKPYDYKTDPEYIKSLSKLDSALKGGIIDKATYDKYLGLAQGGQIDIINAKLTEDTTNFLRGNIDTGAPDLSTFEAPEFSPEQVKTWYDSLAVQEQPLEQEQMSKISEYYNAVNPYTTGSGGQIKSTNEQLAKTIADRYGRAMGLGQQEYEKKYNLALQDWENKYNDYWKRVSRDWGATDVANQRASYTSGLATKRAQDLADQKTAYGQATSNAYLQRDWANQDWNKQASLAEKMAQMQKPAQKSWLDYLSPIATGIGYGYGTKLGGQI